MSDRIPDQSSLSKEGQLSDQQLPSARVSRPSDRALSFSALLDSTRMYFFPILGTKAFRNAGKEMNTTLKISYPSLKKIFFNAREIRIPPLMFTSLPTED